MSVSNPDFYAQYGLRNVREAMKRRFDQAFPAWAGRPAPQLQPLPQLYSRVVTETPLWTGYPVTDGEQVAKRRRGEGVTPVPLVTPIPVMPQSAPMLMTRPTTTDAAVQSPPAEATELYVIEGLTNADLFQCVQLLGLDENDGMKFLKTIAKDYVSFRTLTTEPLDLAKRAIKLLDSMSTGIERGVLSMPLALQGKLVGSVASFLRKTHESLRRHHPLEARQIPEATLRLFNSNPAAFRTMQRYGLFNDCDSYRFAGGRSRFEFLNWCMEKHIRLSDDELGGLLELKLNQSEVPYQSVYDRLQSLAGNKGARHEDRFAT
jgi:hypothetical protein